MPHKVRKRTKHKKGVLKKENAKRTERVTSNKHRGSLWVFNCSGYMCNKEIKTQAGSFKTHTGKCASCSQKGLPYEASYNELYNSKKRNYEVELTYGEYLEICQLPNCHYCEKPLDRQPFSKDNGVDLQKGRAYMLDRKDNRIHYTKDNVVPSCWKCNQSKADRYTYEEWYGMTEFFRMNGR